jgi:hypothetical protein
LKRIVFVFFLLTLFLSSCDQKIDTDLNYESYTLSTLTFESFYQVLNRIDDMQDHTLITIEFLPKGEYLISDAEISIRVYFEFLFEEMEYKGHFEKKLILDGSSQWIEESYNYGTDYHILGYEIFDASGLIQSQNQISIESKSYTRPFELEESKTDMLALYIELLEKIDQLDFNAQNHLTRSLLSMTHATRNNIPIMNQTFTFDERLIREPFYYRTFADDRIEEVYFAHENQIIRHLWSGWIHQGKRMFYSEYFESDDLSFDLLDTKIITSYFLFKDLSITKQLETYTISGYAKDLILKSEFEGLQVFFSEIPLSVLESVVVTYTFNFSEDLVIIRNITFSDSNANINYNQTIVLTYSTLEIIPINPLTDARYEMMIPFLIRLVYEDSNLLDIVHGDGINSNHFYRGYLEKGVYQFEHFSHQLWFRLYDANQNPITNGIAPVLFKQPFFEIKESGYYYIEIIRLSAVLPDYAFQLIKTDLNDYVYDSVLLTKNEPTTVILESMNDIIKLSYTAQSLETVQISYSSIKPIDFIYIISNAEFIEVLSDVTTLTLTPGVHYFYIRTLDETIVNMEIEVTLIPISE